MPQGMQAEKEKELLGRCLTAGEELFSLNQNFEKEKAAERSMQRRARAVAECNPAMPVVCGAG